MRIFAHANYPFLEWRRRAYIITGILLVVGLGGMIRNIVADGSWMEYGVDFTGGTVVQLEFTKPVTADQIRDASGGQARGWEIFQYGSGNEYLIRMPTFSQQTSNDAAQIVNSTLTPAFGANSYHIVRTEAVGAKVGDELQQRALLAILLSLGVTLIYLAIRFEWRFGVAAVVATAHDMLITLGFLAVIQSEISIGTVAALLTVVGYSLNDTIIVFDRIRENLRTPGRHSLIEVLDRSINETLPRTVLTSATSATVLLTLLLLGGPVIRDFALVLLLGVVIGTFSSIFVASPVLYFIETKWPREPESGRAPTGGTRKRNTAPV
jgi:preprotein translocase subunit SecF